MERLTKYEEYYPNRVCLNLKMASTKCNVLHCMYDVCKTCEYELKIENENCPLGQIIRKLAQYEDICPDPSELAEIKEEIEVGESYSRGQTRMLESVANDRDDWKKRCEALEENNEILTKRIKITHEFLEMTESKRNRLEKRCEALERAIFTLDIACDVCKNRTHKEDEEDEPCYSCRLSTSEAWEFDELRFSEGSDGDEYD